MPDLFDYAVWLSIEQADRLACEPLPLDACPLCGNLEPLCVCPSFDACELTRGQSDAEELRCFDRDMVRGIGRY